MSRPRIHACYSESHVSLVEKHFLPSVPPGFDVVLRKIPQTCPDGSYDTPGWNLTMSAKVDFILDAIASEKNTFILSDVDVRFYDLQPSELDSLVPPPHQLAYALNVPLERSQGVPKYCAGFAIIRPSTSVWCLYQTVRRNLLTIPTEQKSLYSALSNAPTELATYLPPERFWSLTHPAPSPNMAIHHASWVKGVDNKVTALDTVLKSR